MAKYRINPEGGVEEVDRLGFIPEDELNLDWQDYKQWLRDGGDPDPAPVPPEPTGDELLDESDQSMIRLTDWLVSFLIGKNTVKITDIPIELRKLYEARQGYFTAAGGIYTEESKLKKILRALLGL